MVTFDVLWVINAHNMPVTATKPFNCIFTVFTVNTNRYSTMVLLDNSDVKCELIAYLWVTMV